MTKVVSFLYRLNREASEDIRPMKATHPASCDPADFPRQDVFGPVSWDSARKKKGKDEGHAGWRTGLASYRQPDSFSETKP